MVANNREMCYNNNAMINYLQEELQNAESFSSSEGNLAQYIYYGNGPLLLDSSQLSTTSDFVSQRKNVWATPSSFVEAEQPHSTGFSWVVSENVKRFDFTLPCQEGIVVSFESNVLGIEFAYRVDNYWLIQGGKLIHAGGKRFYPTGPVQTGDTYCCQVTKTDLVVSNAVPFAILSHRQEILGSTTDTACGGVGLVIKMENGEFYHCRYSSSKSQADIDAFAVGILFNVPVAVNDYAVWASIRENGGTSFSPLHEDTFQKKHLRSTCPILNRVLTCPRGKIT